MNLYKILFFGIALFMGNFTYGMEKQLAIDFLIEKYNIKTEALVQWGPISEACNNENVSTEVLREFLMAGAEPNEVSDLGNIPLQLKKITPEKATLLIKFGGDLGYARSDYEQWVVDKFGKKKVIEVARRVMGSQRTGLQNTCHLIFNRQRVGRPFLSVQHGSTHINNC